MCEWWDNHKETPELMAFELFGAAETVWDDFTGEYRPIINALSAFESLDKSFPGGYDAMALPFRLLVKDWEEGVYKSFIESISSV